PGPVRRAPQRGDGDPDPHLHAAHPHTRARFGAGTLEAAASPRHTATVTGTGSLEARLARVAAEAPGRLGVAVRDDRGWTWTHDADRVTRSASTIKVPILLAALRRVEAGRLDLWDDVAIAPFEQRVGGSGALRL